MKKYRLGALVLLMLMLTGCGVQLNRRDFVSMMGISEDNGMWEVSVRIYSPSEEESEFLSGTGTSYHDAVRSVEHDRGKELFLGRCEAVIADKDVISHDNRLRLLLGEGISAGCPVIYSESPAEVLDKWEDGEVLINRMKEFMKDGMLCEAPMMDVCSAVFSGKSVVIPEAEGDFSGGVMLKNGGVFRMNLTDMQALSLLRGGDIRFSFENCMAQLSDVDVNIYKHTGEVSEYDISIDACCTVTELSGHRDEECVEMAKGNISYAMTNLLEKAEKQGFLGELIPSGDGYGNLYNIQIGIKK
ncbi:MAG: hypothetical protein ACI4Q6_08000 [Huintestinicola sp.]